MMDNVIIKNERGFENKKRALVSGRAESLLIVGDFGRTFTKCFRDGEKISTSFAQIRDRGYLGEEYKKKALELFNKYYPIESDQEIDKDYKVKRLVEWWRIHMNLITGYGWNKKMISQMIKDNEFPLREGVENFVDKLKVAQVPLVIVSQGLGDMYIECLRDIDKLYENIFFVTNLFEFNEEGEAIGVKDTIINSFNKDRIDFQDLPFFDKIKNRKNVILLGDYLEDLDIIRNLNYDNVIKIGFLNEKIEERIEEYKENFDAVITDDGDFEFVNELVEEIVKD